MVQQIFQPSSSDLRGKKNKCLGHSRCSLTAQGCWFPRHRAIYKCSEHFRLQQKGEVQAPYPKPGFLCHFQSLVCGVQLTDIEYPVKTAAGRSRNTTSQFPSGGLGCQHWRRSPPRESPSSGLASKTRTCMAEKDAAWRVGGSGFCICFVFNFYWSIVDLHCCVSFCYTAKWFSYTYTHIHSLLDSFPIEVIIDYWVPCANIVGPY